ncbi:nicotinate-nucleotide--dimethylbenzimidazole phosphoribosyltransferase [candidate division KSB1 bacterium]|nr:nicotinate-nucleotide--dimethylbenzimidazole phosphoribosyltransferase [candidate division KSB1 bacterium]NIR70916.1 nicotinate-nucleotide--dimethylbenzimidazole phosphoribosyltransferase [candidate division KSB1 bacterium]NIS23088.1 nicotinate-nucleotide--dimethylbenzimidazole phosphoribosyltransferase [candidate division KSB1 bacterium]NIT69923.1 nicotinate-nucleotide--dimethylbenzimidazole phosphoribosyltransferase [candidate division KSB1 bacterium]NIU23589.1 nicotinate-nucleotide--dimet
MHELKDIFKHISPIDSKYIKLAQQHLDQLTKPKRSLGRLEDIACQVVAITENLKPSVDKKVIFVFAADHGIATEGVSAYPPDVTAQMVRNFLRGGAGINVLARHIGAEVRVIDIGVDYDFESLQGLHPGKIRKGTRNMLNGPAMTHEEAFAAIQVGLEVAKLAKKENVNVVGAGEMGIGNTTASSAILSVVIDCEEELVTGFGAGLTSEQRQHKVDIIKRAIEVNRDRLTDPLSVLAALGGFEIAGLCGFILGCAKERLPVAVDGFISSVAALVAVELHPTVKDYLFFSHLSNEQGHTSLLNHLNVVPLLNLAMGLGEGTGAALAMHLVEGAIKLYNEMATFDEAQVSKRLET